MATDNSTPNVVQLTRVTGVEAAPGVRVTRGPYWDTFTGTRDALISACIADLCMFPELPKRVKRDDGCEPYQRWEVRRIKGDVFQVAKEHPERFVPAPKAIADAYTPLIHDLLMVLASVERQLLPQTINGERVYLAGDYEIRQRLREVFSDIRNAPVAVMPKFNLVASS